MTNYNRIDKLIDSHFESTPKEIIIESLNKYESNLEQLACQEQQDRKNVLVDLIVNSKAFDIKKNKGFALESDDKSQYYIRLLEIVENGQGHILAQLMTRYMDQVDSQIHRIVGILKKGDEKKREISQEKYHLSSILATVAGKLSCDLIYQRQSKEKFQFWQDGKLSDYKKVAIVDEVITTGTGVIQAVKYLKEFHKEVIIRDVFVYVSRATGQRLENIQDQLHQLDVRLHYIIDEIELIELLHGRNYPEIDLVADLHIQSQ